MQRRSGSRSSRPPSRASRPGSRLDRPESRQDPRSTSRMSSRTKLTARDCERPESRATTRGSSDSDDGLNYHSFLFHDSTDDGIPVQLDASIGGEKPRPRVLHRRKTMAQLPSISKFFELPQIFSGSPMKVHKPIISGPYNVVHFGIPLANRPEAPTSSIDSHQAHAVSVPSEFCLFSPNSTYSPITSAATSTLVPSPEFVGLSTVMENYAVKKVNPTAESEPIDNSNCVSSPAVEDSVSDSSSKLLKIRPVSFHGGIRTIEPKDSFPVNRLITNDFSFRNISDPFVAKRADSRAEKIQDTPTIIEERHPLRMNPTPGARRKPSQNVLKKTRIEMVKEEKLSPEHFPHDTRPKHRRFSVRSVFNRTKHGIKGKQSRGHGTMVQSQSHADLGSSVSIPRSSTLDSMKTLATSTFIHKQKGPIPKANKPLTIDHIKRSSITVSQDLAKLLLELTDDPFPVLAVSSSIQTPGIRAIHVGVKLRHGDRLATCTAVISSGSETNFLSTALIKALRLVGEREYAHDGHEQMEHEQDSQGKLVFYVPLIVDSVSTTWKMTRFSVKDMTNMNMLLGMPWLTDENPVISWRAREALTSSDGHVHAM